MRSLSQSFGKIGTTANPVLNTDSSHLAAAIRFTPDVKRIVVSNRGENSLVVFDFDEATGRLAFKARTLLTGSWPRDFIFVSPTLALVAMERSGEVHALRFDAASGGFSVLSTLSDLFRPVALLCGPNREVEAGPLRYDDSLELKKVSLK